MGNGGRQALVPALLLSLAVLAACNERTGRPLAAGTGAPPSGVPSASATPSPPAARPEVTPPRRKKPNILLLLTDDQALSDLAVMPRTLARIRDRGTEFTRAFSAYPLCCPARATILTGELAHNHGVMGNEPPWGGVSHLDETETLPVWLQRAGYRTAAMGKYLHGYPEDTGMAYVPPGWDQWHVPVVDAYDYYDYAWNDNGVVHSHSGRYETDFVRDRAVDLVSRLAAGRKPFFFWVNFLAPHVGTPVERDDPRARFGDGAVDTPAVASRHRGDMKGRRVPRTKALNERDMSDKGPFMRLQGKRKLGSLDELYQQRLESLLSVDEAVGSILRALERSGEYDDTLIVFGSDNGYSMGAHRWVSKILGYEESARIPLLMAGPGVTRHVERDQLVSLADLTATFLDVAGAKARLPQDGLSLLPLSNAAGRAAHRALLLEAGGWPYRDLDRLYTGVRTADDRVLLRWWDGTEEVYDLRRDRHQLDGRVDAQERPGLRELRRALARLQDCKGKGCSSVSVG